MSLVRSDIVAKAQWLYEGADGRRCLKALLTDGTFAMLIYRLMQWCDAHKLGPVSMVLGKINAFFGGCIIGRGAQFGPGFVLIHSQGIVINGAVTGGDNIKIEHQVTIGAERGKSPRIGDDVFIGAGAKIVGSVSVGSRVKIGANAVIVKDVPDDVTAVGVSAKYIEHI